jgi:hypothetical protein
VKNPEFAYLELAGIALKGKTPLMKIFVAKM